MAHHPAVDLAGGMAGGDLLLAGPLDVAERHFQWAVDCLVCNIRERLGRRSVADLRLDPGLHRRGDVVRGVDAGGTFINFEIVVVIVARTHVVCEVIRSCTVEPVEVVKTLWRGRSD